MAFALRFSAAHGVQALALLAALAGVAVWTPLLLSTAESHTPPAAALGKPPIFYSDIDRNGDGIINATDTSWLYKEVRGRVNFTDILASPLLRKPSNNHHNGGLQIGFDTSLPPGDAGRTNYDLFLNWILNGAPE